jgi:hypothetical protein
MSETTGTPAEGTPDTTPTEALQLADQEPLAAAPAAPAPASTPASHASGGSHTRTILEVIGGVVAAGLIVAAGAVGFAVGHATGDDDGGRWSMTSDSRGSLNGPDAGAPMPGQGQGQGRERGQGQQPGQGQGQQPGQGGGFGHHDGDGFGHRDGDGEGFMGHDDDGDGFMGGGAGSPDGTTTPQG